MSYEKSIELYDDGIGRVDYVSHMGTDLTIVNAARDRNIPAYNLTEGTSYTQLGHGIKQRRFQATVTDASGIIGHSISDDKEWTKQILADAGVPVPPSQRVPAQLVPRRLANQSALPRAGFERNAASPPKL